jgi:hypothetical protein
MQFSPYSVWQNNHDVTNDIYIAEKEFPLNKSPFENAHEEPITKPINNIADLISVADQVKMLKLIKPELESINAMIGMQTIKKYAFTAIHVYFVILCYVKLN